MVKTSEEESPCITKKAMVEPTEKEEEGTTTNPKDKGEAADKNNKKSGSMAPYLSRMKDIIILCSKMEENKDVKKHLKLE